MDLPPEPDDNPLAPFPSNWDDNEPRLDVLEDVCDVQLQRWEWWWRLEGGRGGEAPRHNPQRILRIAPTPKNTLPDSTNTYTVTATLNVTIHTCTSTWTSRHFTQLRNVTWIDDEGGGKSIQRRHEIVLCKECATLVPQERNCMTRWEWRARVPFWSSIPFESTEACWANSSCDFLNVLYAHSLLSRAGVGKTRLVKSTKIVWWDRGGGNRRDSTCVINSCGGRATNSNSRHRSAPLTVPSPRV